MKTMIFELVNSNSSFRNLNIALCVNNLLLKITESHLFLEILKKCMLKLESVETHTHTVQRKSDYFYPQFRETPVKCWYIKFHLQLNN